MKTVEKDDLNDLFHNVLQIEPIEGGFMRFHRFTLEQERQYDADGQTLGKDYHARTLASSNVVLDVITDSNVIGINYRWQEATGYNEAVFDFYIDGVLSGYHITDNMQEGILAFDIPDGKHRVTLFFPWQVITDIRNVVLSDWAILQPIQKKWRILVLGDSISQGYICRHPSLSYVGCLMRKMDAECLNQAIGGYWFEEKALDDNLAQWKPDLIISAYGTNDYFLHNTKESFLRGVKGFVERLSKIFPKTPILGIMPICRFDEMYAAKQRMVDFSLKEAHDIIRTVYRQYPNISILEDNFFPRHEDFFSPDMIHPNDLGFQFFGEAVTEKACQILLDT